MQISVLDKAITEQRGAEGKTQPASDRNQQALCTSHPRQAESADATGQLPVTSASANMPICWGSWNQFQTDTERTALKGCTL